MRKSRNYLAECVSIVADVVVVVTAVSSAAATTAVTALAYFVYSVNYILNKYAKRPLEPCHT